MIPALRCRDRHRARLGGPGGITSEEATQIVKDLVWADARVWETFLAPVVVTPPTSFLMDQYDSRVLTNLIEERMGDETGDTLVEDQEKLVESRYEAAIARVDLLVGEMP